MAGRKLRQWGAFWRDGKFYQFTAGTVLVVRGWPELHAWRKTPTAQTWQRVRPELRLDLPDVFLNDHTPRTQRLPRELPAVAESNAPDEEADPSPSVSETPPPAWLAEAQAQAAEARRRLAATIPSDVRELLAPFATRQWHLAVLLARCPGARDLVRDNPALAFCLASSWCFRRRPVHWPLRAARRLVTGRQRDLLAWLDFPAIESMVRLLRKVPPAACRVPWLLSLRRLAKDPWAAPQLRHLPRLNATALTLLGYRGLQSSLTPALVRELTLGSPDGEISSAVRMLEDTWQMGVLVGHVRRTPFRSLRKLRRVHDTYVAALREQRRQVALEEAGPFPEPPVPGTPDIVPLTSARDLIEEGEAMQHCVAIYAARVLAGGCYVYRVLRPERATVCLARTEHGWVLEQCAGVANAVVGNESLATVERWLNGCAADAAGLRPLR